MRAINPFEVKNAQKEWKLYIGIHPELDDTIKIYIAKVSAR